MEGLAGFIVVSGCGYTLYQQMALGFPPLVAGVILLIGAILLLLEIFPTNARFVARTTGFKFRSLSGKGSYCSILVHSAVILSTFQDKSIYYQDVGPVVLVTYCLSVLVASLPVHLSGTGIVRDRNIVTLLLAAASITIGMTSLVCGVNASLVKLGLIEILVIVMLALLTVIIQCVLQASLPESFSLGEASIISHGLSLLFIFNHLLLHKVSRHHPVRPYSITAASDVTVFLQTAGGSSLAVILALFFGPSLQNTVSFYVVVLGVAGAVATPILILALDKHFILWIMDFVTKDHTRVKLFMYWGACCVAAGLLLRWGSLRLHGDARRPWTNTRRASTGSHSSEECSIQTDSDVSEENTDDGSYSFRTEDSREDSVRDRSKSGKAQEAFDPDISGDAEPSQPEGGGHCHGAQPSHNGKDTHTSPKDKTYTNTKGCGNSVIVARKYFHVFAIVVFVPGLIIDREMLMVAATCALIVFVMLECMRKIQVWPVGEVLEEWYSAFVDKRDSGPVVLTHIYLLLGCTIPLWLYPHPLEEGIHPALLSGLLSLGVGDAAASVIGTKCGMYRWPGTKKTVEGTLGAIVCQVLALGILDHFDLLIGVDWNVALGAITLTSLLEAFTSQIDNLILPLFMYILLVDPLRSCYR